MIRSPFGTDHSFQVVSSEPVAKMSFFGLYESESENRRKARALKKKGGKPLGGKLFKMF
jgi:hypothetical protein